MAGPLPKDPKLRQRRNKSATAVILKEPKPRAKASMPELPKRRRKWRAETVSWWGDLWKSPMAAEFIESDLHQLYILADLVDEYWRVPAKEIGKKKELANEIRLQRQCFGLTPIDRRRLQWEIERGESASAKGEKRRSEGKRVKIYKIDPRDILEKVN